MQRTTALSLSSLALVTLVMSSTPAPAHAFGPGTFVVGLAKTMLNMAKEPFEILLLPVELMDDSDHTPSINTDQKGPAAQQTTTTTTTTKTTTP